jgi:serine/threonine-protein kinase
VFYEALSGAPPFRSASPRELLNLQCTAEPPPLGDIVRRGLPRGVELLIHSLLEKDPTGRPASATDVLERLAPLRPADGGIATVVERPDATPRASARALVDEGEEASATSAARPIAGTTTGKHLRSQPSSSTLRSGRSNPPVPAEAKDTVALLDAASAPREISTPLAILLVLALSILAGIVTVLLRARPADERPRVGVDDPSVSRVARVRSAAAQAER